VRLRAACRAAAALAVLVLVTAGCGATSRVREPDLVVSGATPAPRDSVPAQEPDESTTIAVVTHGQASSAFWAIVRNGIDAAERQMNVEVDYRAPDVYDVRRMAGLIDAAVAGEPDGLVVSIPAEELAPAIRRAIRAGIPVVSINSGSDLSRRLGTLAHIGQPEEKAGYEAGKRLIAAGAANALCVNQEVGNEGLDRRCAGFARALREDGRVSRVLEVDDTDLAATRERVADAASQEGVDAVLTLNATVAEIAAESAPRRVVLGTFDYSPEVLTAVASGRIEFAVDQQPYLQGYLPIMLLAERARYGLFPAEGEVIPTGPSFITRENAAQVERLSQLGIR
jgi:simple sugar transport system substrate-binding protein